MTAEPVSGAEALCRALERAGIDTVYGLVGTQTLSLFEALRTSRLRTVSPTDELKAAFMAIGHYRATGRPAALTTIPGPGFTYALTGLAEARHDSAALVYLAVVKSDPPGERFQFQVLDQAAMAAPVVKAHLYADSAENIPTLVTRAAQEAVAGEPGPVLVEIPAALLDERIRLATQGTSTAPTPVGVSADDRRVIIERFDKARKPLLLIGQGAAGEPEGLRTLAERRRAPIAATCSGRGTIPEDHPLVACADLGAGAVDELNALIDACDLVLALGCKFTHNGSAGFRLRLPAEKLIHVDASPEVLNANYRASLAAAGDVPALIRELVSATGDNSGPSEWTDDELRSRRERIRTAMQKAAGELPLLQDGGDDVRAFFAALDSALPSRSIVVTDTGLHQTLARSFLTVRSVRGLITPADFQSMGFGLPAAVGAAMAAPGRHVAAIIGDGGMAMAAMELVTAVRENVPMTVFVFNDGGFGLMRRLQVAYYGATHAVALTNPDFRSLAQAVGAEYVRIAAPLHESMRAALSSRKVVLAEVRLREPLGYRARAAARQASDLARRAMGPRLRGWVKRLLKR